MNGVHMTGRLCRNAEMNYTKTGFPITNFTIAVNRNVKKGENWEEETYFFDVQLPGKRGEALHDKGYLAKGKLLGVEGFLKQDRWKDKDTGENRSRIYICADNIEILQWDNATSGPQDGAEPPDVSRNDVPVIF
ncbi:MAG: single-stranded DNA-binding protein [Treponema sp.]|nr:single-stranded DNA-binding protein [Treponema sp.]